METKMKSVRLSAKLKNDVRAGMLNQFEVKHKVEKEDIKNDVLILAKSLIPDNVKKLYESNEDLIENGYLSVTSCATICNGRNKVTFLLGENIPHSRSVNMNWIDLKDIKKNNTNKKIFEFMEYFDKKKKFRNDLNQILDSCSSTKQLIERLPIAKNYLPDNKVMVSGTLIPIEKINYITDMLK